MIAHSAIRNLVDEDLIPLIDHMAAFDHSRPLAELRTAFLAALPDPVPEYGFRRSEHYIAGLDGAPDVRILLYVPDQAGTTDLPALLHIHGGGYTLGAPEMGDVRNAALCTDLGCVIVSVDYRLAPDAVYPAALQDCHAALAWVHAHADALGVDRARIGIYGESAGGGHAAALALLARDHGIPIAFQWLVYPMIDDRTGTTSEPHPYAGAFVWTVDANRAGWRDMLGCEPGGPPPGPYAAPARVEDLAGLPPTLIQTGALDLFVDENIDYARRLLRAGVPTELHVYPGAIHGFTLLRTSRSARAATADSLQALRRAFGQETGL